MKFAVELYKQNPSSVFFAFQDVYYSFFKFNI